MRAIALRGTVIEPDSPEFDAIKEAYTAAEELLEGLRLRHLKDNELDQRFLEILQHQIMPYHKLISQHGMEYFDRLRQADDRHIFPELTLYRSRRRDIVRVWQTTYKRTKKRANATHPQEG